MNCQVCGAGMPPGAAWCQRCGAAPGPAQQGGPGAPDQPADTTGPADSAYGANAASAAGWAPPPMAAPPVQYSLGPLATALTIMLALEAVASLISIGLPVLDVVAGLVFLPLIPVFIVWFYQARKNAEGRGWRQRWGPGWAIGAWFVPVILLWFPYQIMADIWRAGLPASQRSRPAWLPIIWWACWLLAWFTGFRTMRTDSGLFHSVTTGFYFDGTVPSKIFVAAAAVALILVVRAVTSDGVGRPPQPDEARPPAQAS
jgi:uncharacterized protein DUF4328